MTPRSTRLQRATGLDATAGPAMPSTSLRSISSTWSVGSILSIGSGGSILSIGSVGSVLSIGSSGSILSIGSVGSILSIGSSGSIGTVGTSGGLRRPTRPVVLLAGVAVVAGAIATGAAITGR